MMNKSNSLKTLQCYCITRSVIVCKSYVYSIRYIQYPLTLEALSLLIRHRGAFCGHVYCGHVYCDGVYCGGVYCGGAYYDGVYCGGVYCGGAYCDGVYCGHVYYDGVYCDGVVFFYHLQLNMFLQKDSCSLYNIQISKFIRIIKNYTIKYIYFVI